MKNFLLILNSIVSIVCVIALLSSNYSTIVNPVTSVSSDSILVDNGFDIEGRLVVVEAKLIAINKVISKINYDSSKSVASIIDYEIQEGGTVENSEAEVMFWQSMDDGLSQQVEYDVDSDLDRMLMSFESVQYSSSCESTGCKITLSSDDRRSLVEAKMTLMTNPHWGQTQFYVPPQNTDSEYNIYIKM